MSNSTAVSVQFKVDSMTAILPAAISTLKAALYLTSATTNGSNTAYTATGEASGTGYTAGGVAVTAATAPSASGTNAIWTPTASIVYTTITPPSAVDTIMIYDTARTNKAIGTWNFGSQTITAGTLTLTMPANAVGTALLQC